MDAKTGFFYLFSAVMLFAAFRVITARNPVHAVLNLILAFSQAAGIWLLLKAEFLGIALVVVYLGAVMVLFMFVVMMLDIRIDRVRQGFWKHFPVAAFIGALVALEMAPWTRPSLLQHCSTARVMFCLTPTHRLWVVCCTPSTCTPSKSQQSCCWLR